MHVHVFVDFYFTLDMNYISVKMHFIISDVFTFDVILHLNVILTPHKMNA